MARHDDIEKMHAFFKARRYPASKQEILQYLECSPSTFKRILKTLKEIYGAPLEYSRQYQGYQYTDDKFELSSPSLWLNSETLLALVSTQKLLSHLKLDFLDQPLSQLKQQITQYLRKQHHADLQRLDRIRILPINARIHNKAQFQLITAALLQGKRLHITYYARGTNQTSQRTISPQRLAHYKDNWYLDAWCHLREEMRIFSLDGIREAQADEASSVEIDATELDALLTAGYGIFSGNAQHTATLIFSVQRARWVADEQWHPNQQATWLTDGRYQLQIPYADPRELLMDIMRHLPGVEVVSPPELKNQLLAVMEQAFNRHQKI